MIKAGDIVRVTDWRCQYVRCSDWFNTHIASLKTEWLIKYAYGDRTHYIDYIDIERACNDNKKYRVLYVDEYEKTCLITRAVDYSKHPVFEVYLIGLKGVELYNKPTEMTISEIEEKLGVKNLKIIEE